MQTARIYRLVASGVLLSGNQIISAIQVVGGTADAVLYEDTSAVAANAKITITSPSIVSFDTPIKFQNVYVDFGIGVTEVCVHVV